MREEKVSIGNHLDLHSILILIYLAGSLVFYQGLLPTFARRWFKFLSRDPTNLRSIISLYSEPFCSF